MALETPLWKAVAIEDDKLIRKWLSAFSKQQLAIRRREKQKLQGRNCLTTLPQNLDINSSDPLRGMGAIHLAVVTSRQDILKKLVMFQDIRIDATTKAGCTALMKAAHSGNLEACEILLRSGASSTHRNKLNFSAIQLAAFRRNTEIVEAIKDHDAMMEEQRKAVLRAKEFRQACLHGKRKVVEAVLESGTVDVNAADDQERTALHYAAIENHVVVCKVLLKAGANKAAQNAKGETALHLASQRGFSELVALLQLELHEEEAAGGSK